MKTTIKTSKECKEQRRADLLSSVASKLKDKELFPEKNKRAKEILDSVVEWPDFLKAENH